MFGRMQEFSSVSASAYDAESLTTQLDLVPLPLDPDSRVYENTIAGPLAGTADRPWDEDGLGFSGPAVDGGVPVAMNYDGGWSPDPAALDWQLTVEGSDGSAVWFAPTLSIALSASVIGLLAISFGLILLGRRRT